MIETLDLTCDEPASGLRVWQPKRGFRYAMDPFLLAGWALEGGVPRRFVDVGTGSGIMALLFGRLGLEGTGIDVRPEWVEMASRSAGDSGITSVRFVHGDVRNARLEPVDLVVSNPPYWAKTHGTLSPDPLKAHARHELSGTLEELLEAMGTIGERVAVIVPSAREAETVLVLHGLGRPVGRLLRLGGTLSLVEGRVGASTIALEEAPLRAPENRARFGDRVREIYDRTGARLADDRDGA